MQHAPLVEAFWRKWRGEITQAELDAFGRQWLQAQTVTDTTPHPHRDETSWREGGDEVRA